ncbi:TIR domain-containing protein [Clavibacter michiganensis]|uniref:TIR domain-containing protein n=1 Tax=Clavibacter michiganensis TaxID=28447 RepID=UPI003EBD313A
MTDVFLSYSIDDSNTAHRLAEQLEEAGLSLARLDETPVGKSFAQAISTAAAQASVFVLLQPAPTNAPLDSHVYSEAAIARNALEGKPLLPVLLPGRHASPNIGQYRAFKLESDGDLGALIKVIQDLVRSVAQKPKAQAGSPLSLYISLLRSDIHKSPQAGALVLDEITQLAARSTPDALLERQSFSEALTWGERTLGRAHPSVGSLRRRLAIKFVVAADYESALHLIQSWISTSTTSDDRIEAKLMLGNTYLASARYAEAQDIYSDVVVMARASESLTAEGTALTALANTSRARGDYAASINYYSSALTAMAPLMEPIARLHALVGVAEMLERTGDRSDRSRGYVDEALKLTHNTSYVDERLLNRLKKLTDSPEALN